MYYPDELIEKVRTRNDIVDAGIRLCPSAEKREAPISESCPFHNENRLVFCQQTEADVLLLRMRGRGKCIYVFDGV